MSFFTKVLNISLPLILILITVFLMIVVCFFYIQIDPTESAKITPLLGGLLTGLFFLIVQVILSWSEINKLQIYNKLGIKNILETREGKLFYANLLSSSKHTVDLMGHTAYRFIEDFGKEERDDSKSLITALGNGARIRILLTHNEYLLSDTEKAHANDAIQKIKSIKTSHSNYNLEVKFYKHQPTHSILIIDEDILIGPYFPSKESKDTPCIHLSRESKFAQPYQRYFENEWKNGEN